MGKEVIINPDLYFSNLNGELDFFMYKKLFFLTKKTFFLNNFFTKKTFIFYFYCIEID